MEFGEALLQADDQWKSLVCDAADRALVCGIEDRKEARSAWWLAQQIDTCMRVMQLHRLGKTNPRYEHGAPISKLKAKPSCGQSDRAAETDARRRLRAVQYFGIVDFQLEGQAHWVNLSLPVRHDTKSLDTIAELLLLAFLKWSYACSKLELEDTSLIMPVRQTSTAEAYACLMRAGLTPTRPVRQSAAITVMDSIKNKARCVEAQIVQRDMSEPSRVRQAFRTRRIALQEARLIECHEKSNEVSIRLTPEGASFHHRLSRNPGLVAPAA